MPHGCLARHDGFTNEVYAPKRRTAFTAHIKAINGFAMISGFHPSCMSNVLMWVSLQDPGFCRRSLRTIWLSQQSANTFVPRGRPVLNAGSVSFPALSDARRARIPVLEIRAMGQIAP